MPGESNLWSRMRRCAPDGMKLERVEARHPKGMPDVFWRCREERISGWIELKDTEPVLRPEQRILQREWYESGISIITMCRVDEWLYLVCPSVVPMNGRLPLLLSSPLDVPRTNYVHRTPMPASRGEWERVFEAVKTWKLK